MRSTTDQVQYGDVVDEATGIEESKPGVVAPAGTTYYINNSAVQVTGGDVALLFDNIVENNAVDGKTNTDLLKARTNAELGSTGGTRHYELKYLDLVDTNNGNVWVAADQDITVYWPLPEGTSAGTSFKLLHFEGLHREMGVDDVADEIDDCTVKAVTIENTGTHIKFTVQPINEGGGFSPFVLVWETPGGTPSTPSYTLHYVSNGGTEYPDETYPSGTVVDLTKVPIREGYTFTGWYADPELTEKITSVTMTSDKTVYAGWKYTDVPEWLNGDDHFAYIIGYPDGTVQPTGNITRAEVAAVFFRLLKEEVRQEYLTDQNGFNDVLLGRWYNINVSTMASLGIVAGRPGGDFDPNAPITRAEFAAICARFDTTEITGTTQFTDIEGHWAQEEIQRAAALGWILGYPDNTFRPDQYITRAEAMTTINRVLQRLPESESDLLDEMNVWPDNRPGAWYYLAVQEATNTHDFVRKDNFYERWTQMLEDPNWVQYQ